MVQLFRLHKQLPSTASAPCSETVLGQVSCKRTLKHCFCSSLFSAPTECFNYFPHHIILIQPDNLTVFIFHSSHRWSASPSIHCSQSLSINHYALSLLPLFCFILSINIGMCFPGCTAPYCVCPFSIVSLLPPCASFRNNILPWCLPSLAV